MFFGGGQERNYRPGTENTGMIAGLGEACRLVTENLQAYEMQMQAVRHRLFFIYFSKCIDYRQQSFAEHCFPTQFLCHNSKRFWYYFFLQTRDYLEDRLETEFGDQVHFNSRFIKSKRLPNTCNVSFIGPSLKGHKIIAAAKCLQASVGAACHSARGDKPSHILLSCGIPEHIASNAIRLSIGRYTSNKDIDVVIDDLRNVIDELRSAS